MEKQNVPIKYPFPLKWILVSWALIWRAILLPFVGMLLFFYVVLFSLALLKLDTNGFSEFWGNYNIFIQIPLTIFLFEWASNVISNRYFHFENLRFLGWALFWRYQVIYWILIIFLLNSSSLSHIRVIFIEVIAGLILGIWAMFLFAKRKREASKFEKEGKPNETPKYLFRKAMLFVPGLYLLLIIIAALSFTIGIGIIILMLMMPRIYPGIIIALGLGVVLTLFAILNAIRKIIFPSPVKTMAMHIESREQPRFLDIIKEVAIKTKTQIPDHVIISSDCEFSVQNSKVITLDNQKLKGRILTISAPLLHFLTVNELKGILAHEFAHFSGKDTTFSNKIQPIYTGAIETMKSISESGNTWMAIPNLLPRIILSRYIDGFHRINMRISRGREFRSDLIAAEIAGKNIFGKALTKVIALSRIFNNVLSLPEEAKKSFNFDAANFYLEFSKYIQQKPNLIEESRVQIVAEESKIDDIYNSHPALELRIKNVQGMSDQQEESQSAESLFNQTEKWETAFTSEIKRILLSIENRKNTRYVFTISEIKRMKRNKEFINDLAKLLGCDVAVIQNNYFVKGASQDIVKVNNLTEDQAINLVNHFKKYAGDKAIKLDVKVDYENSSIKSPNDKLNEMKQEEKDKLIKHYGGVSDDQLKEFLGQGSGAFKEGVYELILDEFKKREIPQA